MNNLFRLFGKYYIEHKNAATYKGSCLLMFVYSDCWMHY